MHDTASTATNSRRARHRRAHRHVGFDQRLLEGKREARRDRRSALIAQQIVREPHPVALE